MLGASKGLLVCLLTNGGCLSNTKVIGAVPGATYRRDDVDPSPVL